MPNQKNNTLQYVFFGLIALVVLYGMVCLSNTADSYEYKQILIEQGLDLEEDSDFIALYELTEDRVERGEGIAFTESTPKYILYGLFIDFLLFVMAIEKFGKKYAQESMYGDAEWGTVKQFKHLTSKHKKFYLTDYPPFCFVFHVIIYIKVFKKVWRSGDGE